MGDALLPVARTMIEDKAGWGLVPGLQPRYTRTRAAAARSVGDSYYCWAGPAARGWAGARCEAEQLCEGKPLSSVQAPGSKPDLPASLRLWELKRVPERPTQCSDGQQQHRQHSTSQEAGRTA